jgi:crotonobetainyl-CoA:carnitine CoA-transferase CaiB-like acyl-CoA transferase
MSYETLHKLNEQLIFAHLTGYGEADDRAAFDLVLQAETGYMSMNGTAASGPVKMPVALIDVLAAHQLKEGILTALIRRMKTGQGASVQVSLYEAAIASLVNQASNYLQAGHIPALMGSLHPNIAPYGETLFCSDGKLLVLAVGNDKQFRNLLQVLKMEELGNDERFATNASRVRERVELLKRLSQQALSWNSEALKEALDRAGVPAGRILDLKEVFADSRAKNRVLTEIREGMALICAKSVAFHVDN